MELKPAFSSTSGSFCGGICIPPSVVLLLHIYRTIIKVHMVRNLVILNIIIQHSLLKWRHFQWTFRVTLTTQTLFSSANTLKSAWFSSLSTSPGLKFFFKVLQIIETSEVNYVVNVKKKNLPVCSANQHTALPFKTSSERKPPS